MLILRQTLEKPINGYWNGGLQQVFDWTIDKIHTGQDSKGVFIRMSCWTANHWFNVAQGKTDKLTLSYAKKHLQAATSYPCKFEYVEQKTVNELV